MPSKNFNKNKYAPKLILFNEKKMRKIPMLLKKQFYHFLCTMYVPCNYKVLNDQRHWQWILFQSKDHVPITMNMFAKCLLVLILTVALVQTLQCYDCSVKLAGSSGISICKDGEMGKLVDCAGSCLKSVIGRWYFFVMYRCLYKIPQNHDQNK